MNFPKYFPMHDLEYISLYACVGQYCYAKTTISFILVVSSTHDNLVESDAMQKCFLEMLNSTKLK